MLRVPVALAKSTKSVVADQIRRNLNDNLTVHLGAFESLFCLEFDQNKT